METVVSGIRSTGKLHLGNYYGAVQNFVKMQHQFNCFFFIADLHSLTTHPTPADLHGNVKQVLIEYLASGIDPDNEITALNSRNIDRNNPADTVYMDLDYQLKNYIKTIGGISIFTLPWSNKINAGDLQITLPRYSNIDLSQMFDLDNEIEVITLNLAPGKKMVEAIEPVSLKNDIIEYSIIPKQVGNKVVVTRTFKLKKEVVPASRAEEFNTFYKKMVEADNKELAMK